MQLKFEQYPGAAAFAVTASGSYTLPSLRRVFDDFARRARRLDSRAKPSFILDVREATGSLSSLDRYALGVYLTTHLPSARLAIVTTTENLDNEKFFENVVENRGGVARAFTTREDAESWLGWSIPTPTEKRSGTP